MSTQDTNSEEEEGFSREEVIMMQKFEKKGYKITARDAKNQIFTLERPDEISCQAKRPQIDALQETASLSFGGRVKTTSTKNT